MRGRNQEIQRLVGRALRAAVDLDALMAFYDALEGEIPAYALQLPVLPTSSLNTPRPSNR